MKNSNSMKAYHAVNEFDNPKNSPILTKKPGVGEREYPSKKAIEDAGHEMKINPPAILAKTARKYGKSRSKKQRVAIMLSKARKGA